MHTEILSYDADGLTMQSHLFVDETLDGPRPGVLVFPDAFGLADHAKERAERLAGLGYAALACDLHGDGRTVEDLDSVMGLIGPMMREPSHTRARAVGGLQALLARPETDVFRMAAIGFCFGGTMALELARSGAAISGVVGFHSGLGTAAPAVAPTFRAKVLVCLGADDPGVDAAQRAAFMEEMKAAGVDWQMKLYGGVLHSFTNPEAEKRNRPEFLRYDAAADARSWSEMRAFFDEIFSVVAV